MPGESICRFGSIDTKLLTAGKGQTVLFLHGGGGLPPWNVFFDRLSQQYEVLLPEHPGFGTDRHAEQIRSISDLAMYYLDFLDGLDRGHVHLVGHSLGGWAAAELATRNCSRLASLTLIAPAGLRVKGIPAGDKFIWSPEETIRNLYHDQKLAEAILSRPLTEDDADRQLTNRFMAARLGWEPRWFSLQLERWLHRIRVPSLLIWGRDDKVLPCAYANLWEMRVPEIKKRLISDCGHLPHIEVPDEIAEIILSFLGALS